MDDSPSQWRRSRLAIVELILLTIAIGGVLSIGSWVGGPVPPLVSDAERGRCQATGAALLRVELAVPDDQRDTPLPTLGDLLRCADKPAFGQALRTSVVRDFVFIPAYVLVLLWCSTRLAGLGGNQPMTPLADVARRTGGRDGIDPVRAWSVRVLEALDRARTGVLADTPLETEIKEARAAASRAIVAARREEGLERRRIRYARRPGGPLKRWRDRRHERKAAKHRREEAEKASRQARDEAIRTARQRARELPSEPGAASHGPLLPLGQRVRRAAARAALTPVRWLFADGLGLACVYGGENGRLVAKVGAWSVLVAGLLDVTENILLLQTAGDLVDGRTPGNTVVALTAGAAAAKFLLLGLPIALVVLMLRRLAIAPFRSRACETAKTTAFLPNVGDPVRRWTIPTADVDGRVAFAPAKDQGHYGICFSGGGIRSATFALGALQELEQPGQDEWRVHKARYMTAVSGGSYMAAAYQFLARGGAGADPEKELDDLERSASGLRPILQQACAWPVVGRPAGWLYYRTLRRPAPTGDPDLPTSTPAEARRLVRPAGPVEDHLRRHATHLADGAAEWAQALGEMVIRAASGLLVVLLVVWSVAVPLGWAYQYVFHGLDDGQPAPSIDLRIAAGPLLALAAFLLLRLLLSKPVDLLTGWRQGGPRATSEARDHARAATSFGVGLLVAVAIVLPFVTANVESSVTAVGRWTGISPDPPAEPDRDEVNAHLEEIIAGTTAGAAAAVEAAAVVSQAELPANTLAASTDAVGLAAQQATDAVRELAALMDDDESGSDDPSPSPLAARFDPETCLPVATPRPVAGADESLAVRACRAARWAGRTAGAVADLARSQDAGPTTDEVATGLAAASTKASAGAIRASTAARKLGQELSGTAPAGSSREPPVAWAGLSALVTLVGGLTAKRRMDVAKRPKAGPSTSNKVAKMVGFRGGMREVLAGVVAALAALIAFSDVTAYAWRRGAREPLKLVMTQPVWRWWAGAAIVLLVLMFLTNCNNWSLRPFYHRRLWLPYAVTPDGRTADWKTDTRLSEVGRRVEGFPELVICAAAQTSGRAWAPPGRRALSFVFTADAVGGPEVGYIGTRDLETILGRRHRRAITLFGATATSGAAFGPAMGRHSKGGMGAVMAVANARLGAWVPNPHHLARVDEVRRRDQPIRAASVARWPRLWYWFMEIAGQYPTDAKLVLTTDGGHVENLGLVELLRRRCSRILCFDASGAGSTPATLAEAIVMAREELDVEITLRAPAGSGGETATAPDGQGATAPGSNGDAGPGSVVTAVKSWLQLDEFAADPLLRKASLVEALAARIAGRPVLLADIKYPPLPGGTAPEPGLLVYGTLALADDPAEWDLLEFAHRSEIFPNDGTGRQWFDASTFSAYQQLGRRTARRMVDEASREVARESRIPRPAPST